MYIIKSVNDDRNYLPLTLKNGMNCLFVHDPDATISAAALSVKVGSQDDTVNGIAHFLEHMLFMGSKKYPDENLYSSLLAKYAGKSNAFTGSTQTCYYFDVHSEKFAEVLDVFHTLNFS